MKEILNLMSDMTLGFLFAARGPMRFTIGVAIALESMALAMIRDNLTLDVLMVT